LRQRRNQDGRSLEYKALGGANNAVNDGAFEQLSTGPNHHPA
jgi:hypothetical protein